MHPGGAIELELIQLLSEHFKKTIGNPPEGINQFAFPVKDIEKAVKHMDQKGFCWDG